MPFQKKFFLFVLLYSTFGIISAQDSIHQLISSAENKMEIYLEISKSYRDTNFQKSSFYANQALNEAVQKKDKYWQGMAYGSLGLLSIAKGEKLEASKLYFEKAKSLFKEINDKEKEARIQNNIGLLYDQAGDYKKALEYYLDALKLYKEAGFKTGIGEATNNVGVIYDILDEFDLSIKYYQESIEIARELGDSLGLTMSMINIGYVEIRRNNIEKGLKIINEVIEIKKVLGDSTGIAMAYNNLAEVYSSLDDLPTAKEYILKAIEINNACGKTERLGSNYYNLAWVLDEMKQPDLAIEAAHKGLNIADHFYDQSLRLKLLALLTDLYAIKNNYKLAFEYSVSYLSLYDSLESSQKLKDVQDLKTQYETEKKEQELLLEKERRARAELSDQKTQAVSERKSTIIYAAAAVGILLLILAFLFYKSALNRKKTNILLEKKKRGYTGTKSIAGRKTQRNY